MSYAHDHLFNVTHGSVGKDRVVEGHTGFATFERVAFKCGEIFGKEMVKSLFVEDIYTYNKFFEIW